MSDEGGEPITEGEKSLALLSLNLTAGMTVAGGDELARPGIIDKSGWGDGAWQDEPDLLQWCARTPPHYECQVARSVVSGVLCGYVAIPAGHPAHGMGWGRGGLDVDVHGDVTFAEQGINGGMFVVVGAPGQARAGRLCVPVDEPGAPGVAALSTWHRRPDRGGHEERQAMSDRGMLFPGPLPEPVELEDLNARLMRLMRLTGYVLALLGADEGRSANQRRQDVLAAQALQWCVPYVRALIELASRHPEEFRAACVAELGLEAARATDLCHGHTDELSQAQQLNDALQSRVDEAAKLLENCGRDNCMRALEVLCGK
jgi:hypothetical protein